MQADGKEIAHIAPKRKISWRGERLRVCWASCEAHWQIWIVYAYAEF